MKSVTLIMFFCWLPLPLVKVVNYFMIQLEIKVMLTSR